LISDGKHGSGGGEQKEQGADWLATTRVGSQRAKTVNQLMDEISLFTAIILCMNI